MQDQPKTCRYLFLLPIVAFCFVPGCFTITYIIAVAQNHVHPVLPMISETGEALPENFVFAIIVNVGAFFGLLNYIARYMVLSRWSRLKPVMTAVTRQRFHTTNRAALIVGFFAAAGAIMVGNIEANRHLYLHNVGAILVVVGQLAYSWMHSYLTAVSPMQPCTVYLRSTLALAMTLAFVTGASSVPWAHGVPEMTEEERKNETLVVFARFIGYRFVNDQHDYFVALLYYHITEWFIVLCAGIFLLSFACEFRKVAVQLPVCFFSASPRVARRDILAELNSPDTPDDDDKDTLSQMIIMDRRDFANGNAASSSLPLVGAGASKDNPYSAATFANGGGSMKGRSFDAASNPSALHGHARMSSLDATKRDVNKFTVSNSMATDIDDDPNDVYCTPAHSVSHSAAHSRQPSDESANYAQNYMRLHQQLSVVSDSTIVMKHPNTNNINGKIDSNSDMHKV